MTESRPLTIKYFAQLREVRGLSSEDLQSTAATPADLYAQLQNQYGFSLPQERLRVAINDRFAEWSDGLQAHDTVAFIPPVGGG